VLVRPCQIVPSLAALLLAACSRDPSPAAVERVLVSHPEVLAAAIKAHPTEFMQAVNGAFQAAQAAQQSSATRSTPISLAACRSAIPTRR
jgi:uncharacterized protein YcfL